MFEALIGSADDLDFVSEDFDALTVAEETISLAGAEVKLAGNSGAFLWQERDVNADDYIDLVCDVETADFMVEVGSSIAELTTKISSRFWWTL